MSILDFNNVRKRMSVILRRDDQILLLCKGADNVIYDRLGPKQEELKSKTQEHLNVSCGGTVLELGSFVILMDYVHYILYIAEIRRRRPSHASVGRTVLGRGVLWRVAGTATRGGLIDRRTGG